MTTYLGLFFEILFLLLGVYLYLFSRGQIKTRDGASFLNDNKTLIRYGSLALIAIMLINIALHIRDIIAL